jgi:hypothetical protein
VGWSVNSTFNGHAFAWSPATGAQDLLPTSLGSSAEDISENGVIVGWVDEFEFDSINGREVPLRAFRIGLQGTEMLQYIPNGLGSEAFGVNASGVAVGLAHDTTCGCQFAVRWDANGNVTKLGGPDSEARDINDSGVIVGKVVGQAFKWTATDGMVQLPRPFGNGSVAWAINNAGYIAGAIDNVAVLWRPDGTVINLGTFGGIAVASDVNNFGVVVGRGGGRGFVWDSIGGVDFLEDSGRPAAINDSRTDRWTSLGTNNTRHLLAGRNDPAAGYSVRLRRERSDRNLSDYPISRLRDGLAVRRRDVVWFLGPNQQFDNTRYVVR